MHLSQLFLNRVFDILVSGVAAENFVINHNVGGLDWIVLMPEAKETGING